MSPEAKLLFSVFRQTIQDYLDLDPDSDCISADFYESEGSDFRVAEDIIFNGEKIYYGELIFTFDDLCELFKEITRLSPREIRYNIIHNCKHY